MTPQQQSDYTAGKVVEMTDMVDKKGQKCTVYLQFNPDKQRPTTSLNDPRVKVAEESRVQKAVNNDGLTNEATKRVAEPMQKYQTAPKTGIRPSSSESQRARNSDTHSLKQPPGGPELPIAFSQKDHYLQNHPPFNNVKKMRQKNITTIVADNRLTADTIARAIGANGRHDGYYLGNGYAVTWTNGNIIEATFRTGESFITSSNMDARLMYAHHFDFAMRDYDSLVGYKKSKQDTRQLDTIRSLWEMSHTVVNAMYPSFEGELQFLNLYWFLRRPVKVRRAWIPVMTNDVIRHAVKHGPADRREHEDWLQGEIVSFFLERFTDAMKALASMPEEEIMEAFTEEELCGIKDGLQNMADAFGTAAPECEPAPEVSEDGRHIHDGNIHIEIVDNPNFMNTALLVAYAQSELGFDEAKTKRVALTLYAKKLISFPLVIQNSIPFGVWKKMQP